MVILGVDAHKHSHTVVAIDEHGRQLGVRTLGTKTADHIDLIRWADKFGTERRWAVEDCRHLSRRFERDLLLAGESIVRVPPKLMAGARNAARTYGKSDPIDALAVARAALREPNLPVATLDGPSRTVRLLIDHREDLLGERTRIIARLRWHLHELEPGLEPATRTMDQPRTLAKLAARLEPYQGVVARLAKDLLERCIALTTQIRALQAEIGVLVEELAPTLLAIRGVGVLVAGKLIGETAGAARFRSKDAFARHNGTAPLPVWSSNKTRHRLSRMGNRQLNAALHRVAVTQMCWHDPAKVYVARRKANGDSTKEALRALKRQLSDVVYRALLADETAHLQRRAA